MFVIRASKTITFERVNCLDTAWLVIDKDNVDEWVRKNPDWRFIHGTYNEAKKYIDAANGLVPGASLPANILGKKHGKPFVHFRIQKGPFEILPKEVCGIKQCGGLHCELNPVRFCKKYNGKLGIQGMACV